MRGRRVLDHRGRRPRGRRSSQYTREGAVEDRRRAVGGEAGFGPLADRDEQVIGPHEASFLPRPVIASALSASLVRVSRSNRDEGRSSRKSRPGRDRRLARRRRTPPAIPGTSASSRRPRRAATAPFASTAGVRSPVSRRTRSIARSFSGFRGSSRSKPFVSPVGLRACHGVALVAVDPPMISRFPGRAARRSGRRRGQGGTPLGTSGKDWARRGR
jgi:hypothetical protein